MEPIVNGSVNIIDVNFENQWNLKIALHVRKVSHVSFVLCVTKGDYSFHVKFNLMFAESKGRSSGF